jgi:diguanylate cyclase (GGDEF)-like protein
VPAATKHRRALFATAIVCYAIVFGSFVLFEVPGLGLGHFFYIPVALLALAFGVRGGFLAGALAAGLYVAAIVLTPRMPTRDALTYATAIRFITFSTSGIVVGWFADKHRRQLEQLRDLAERDFLTGILNTRVFDEALSRRCAKRRPFLLLLGDIDDLKAVNDTHGHAEGNAELRRVADALGGLLGPTDELARVGGDEFAILSDASISDAAAICSTLRTRLAAGGLRMTFGWAALPDDGLAGLELFRKADDRLYAAKLVGRNHRVVRDAVASRA